MVAQIDMQYASARPGRALSRLLSYALFEGRPLTTRGQWINPLLRAAHTHQISRPADTVVEKPIFIVGSGRSGTTLLGTLLSFHRDVGFLNEPKLLWNIAFPNEDLIGSYSDSEARVILGKEDANSVNKKAIHSLYSSYLRISRNTRIVDKYPELVYRVPFVKELFPDAQFIFIVRNGYSTCNSVALWSQSHGQRLPAGSARADWWGRDNRKWRYLVDQVASTDPELAGCIDELRGVQTQVDMAAVEWILAMKAGLGAKEQYPDSIHQIRYEDLVANPGEILSAVMSFCALDTDNGLTEYAEASCHAEEITTRPHISPAIAAELARIMGLLGYRSEL